MEDEQGQIQFQLIRRLEQQWAQDTWPDEENESNPFYHYIEALSSDDSTLLDRSQGDYHLFLDMPPYHPDSILTEARSRVNRKTRSFPAAPLLTPREELIEHYQLLFKLSPKNTKSDDNSRIRQAIMSPAPEFVRVPLASLSPMPISKMMVNKVHQGNYVIVRAVSQAGELMPNRYVKVNNAPGNPLSYSPIRTVRLVAIQVVVEDHEGGAVDLALYNCLETSGLDREGILELIPLGQALLIREPWLTRGRTGGHATIRVDTRTDVIFLPPTHPLLEQYPDVWRTPLGFENDVQAYKDAGNKAFKNGRFESAIQAYSNGLSIDPGASLLRLNRSLCYLNINKPSLALNDARAVSEDEAMTDIHRSKAEYRMALAYYALDQFTNALAVLEAKVRPRFSPKDFSELEQKTRQRLLEQEQGNYDWFALKKMVNKINGHRQIPDVADYVGPVKVVHMNTMGGGRGLVTTRDVCAGELLLVSKPFAFAASVEYPELFRVLQARSDTIVERPSFELVGRTMQRIDGDHTAASALFLDLHSNSATPKTPPLENNSATFLANDCRYWDISGEYQTNHIDANQVEGIITSNGFHDDITNSSFGKIEAIYLLPSLVNHSCNGTALRTSVGSIMVMRASRNLKAGEEITCSYVGGVEGGSFISRGAGLKKWSIDCSCELCLADQKDGEDLCRTRERHEEELNELRMVMKFFPGDPQHAETAKDLVAKIRSTYRSKRTAPMDTLGLAQRVFAFTQQVANPNQAVQLYTDALRSHGIYVKETPPKKVPENRSQLRRDALIISTKSFPSQLDNIFRCIKVMATIAAFEIQRRSPLARHWAVACLWVHEAFYGPGKEYLWYSLDIQADTPHPLVVLLGGF